MFSQRCPPATERGVYAGNRGIQLFSNIRQPDADYLVQETLPSGAVVSV
jgi:hypothetical protein